MSEHVVVTTAEAVTTIRLDRPSKKNALTLAMYQGLTEALAAADADPAVRAVVITGSEGCFTAGNDIGDFMTAASTGGDIAAPLVFLGQLADLSKPVVAAVDGIAIGIGTTMLLHCDLVYASPSSRFKVPFVDLGLVPEAASSLLLPAVLGPRLASAMLLLGDDLTAEAAHAAGLINAIAPDVRAAADQAARRLAAKPPLALVASKRLIKRSARELIAETMRIEGAAFAERLRSPEAMAAFASFLKR